MIKKLAYVISSYFVYAPFTLPVILPSLIKSGISPDDIFVVICGCCIELNLKSRQGTFWYVKHDSRNFSVFVEAINPRRTELKQYSHIFLLMDTCKAGLDFYAKSSDIDLSKDAVGANAYINGGCIGDLAAYKLDYLLSQKETIGLFVNVSSINNYYWEGRMFAEAGSKSFYGGGSGRMIVVGKPFDIYGTGTLRITEYYPEIDLYKFKSNWGQHGLNFVDRP
jgi:hypothetical protein